ncbi:MAG: tetratricopeptide repeat protein [Chloroflexi bacterium]|nr:MAG: tetratricopeptide repeat protein [Chloroflexota bacterium]
MSDDDARAELLACAARNGDIAEGALWLATEDCHGVDRPRWLEVVDALAEELRTRSGRQPPVLAAPVIAGLLRDRLGLHGAAAADPRTHYLHTVLERGGGIPIACSAVWIAVGRRAGIEVEGVGLPGHFVVRVAGALVDAFGGGALLDDSEATRLVAAAFGSEPPRLEPEWLEAASTREMLARMSRNLRSCHAALSNWTLALRAADRCVALLPDSPPERRDRGLLAWRCGRAALALDDLSWYLDVVPDAPDHEAISEARSRLRAFLN